MQRRRFKLCLWGSGPLALTERHHLHQSVTRSGNVVESDSDSWPDIMKGGRLAGFIMPRALPPVGG